MRFACQRESNSREDAQAAGLPINFFERANNAHYNTIMTTDEEGREVGIYRKAHIPWGLQGVLEKCTRRRVTPASRYGHDKRSDLQEPAFNHKAIAMRV